MELFTERHGMRSPINRTSTITPDMFGILLECCSKYYKNLSHQFPDWCSDYPDNEVCCGLDEDSFNRKMKFIIPRLYEDGYNWMRTPNEYSNYDQYSLLDLIEYIAKNGEDFEEMNWHSFHRHYHIRHLGTDNFFIEFQKEINGIFDLVGLLFVLTDDKNVERVVYNAILTPSVVNMVNDFQEEGIRELLKDAFHHYKQPHPSSRKTACEKIWDAFEYIKTYHADRKRKSSETEVIKTIGDKRQEFIELFDKEFKTLWAIGNRFDIRHKGTDVTQITNPLHHEYFFNRCLSLILLVISTLGEESP
ncbi:MAG: hypothetical protein FWB98_00630 [Defluviitaleaceae bacterium]|nr:hypothetical protein [Defluviitaleaceae bacterium]